MKEEQKQSLCALADRCQEKRKETKVMHFTLAQLSQAVVYPGLDLLCALPNVLGQLPLTTPRDSNAVDACDCANMLSDLFRSR